MTAAFDHRSDFESDPDFEGCPGHSAEYFDDTDGAYQVTEPDPFTEQPHSRPAIGRPSLRAEIRADRPRAITELSRSAVPPLPVPDDLRELMPGGLRRGSAIAVTSSVSLLLAVIGTASAKGAWTAMVGMPAISAEAAAEAGLDLSRLAIISEQGGAWTGASWTTAVGALLDAVDIVVGRPGVTGGVSDGDARRLTARTRNKDAVLVLFGQQATSWPAVELYLSARHDHWTGIGDGYGRLTAHRLTVSVVGRGRSSRACSTELWLPISTPATAADVLDSPIASRLSQAG